MGLFELRPVAADLAFPLHEVLKGHVQFMVGGLICGLGLHLLVVLIRDVLRHDLVGSGLLLLSQSGNLAVNGGGLGGQLLHRALVGSGLDLRQCRCLLLLQGGNAGNRVLHDGAHIGVLILDRGERLELARVKVHGQSTRRFQVDGTEQLRTAVFERLGPVHGLTDGRGKLSNAGTELGAAEQLQLQGTGCGRWIADIAFHLLGQGDVLLHLLQLLVENTDGFGEFGDVLNMVKLGDGIGHDRDGVLSTRHRREARKESEQ